VLKKLKKKFIFEELQQTNSVEWPDYIFFILASSLYIICQSGDYLHSRYFSKLWTNYIVSIYKICFL